MSRITLMICFGALAAMGQISKYTCDGGERVEVRRSTSGIVFQVVGKPRLTLPPVAGGAGGRFSDGYTTVQVRGKELLVEAGSVNLKGCEETEIDFLSGRWTLIQIRGKGVPKLQRPATLEFIDGGRVSGSGGCNRFGGSVTRNAEFIDIGALAATRMACLSETSQQLENDYLAILQGRLYWKPERNRLDLKTAEGETVLQFER